MRNSKQKLLESIAEVSDKASKQCEFVYDAKPTMTYSQGCTMIRY